MKKFILLFAGLILLLVKSESQTVTDCDGNIYHIVTIGTQEWLQENLSVIHYLNGDSIPSYTHGGSGQWPKTTGVYCNYNFDSTNSNIYGRIYNWYAAIDERGLCPVDWHVPSDADWIYLIDYLGGEDVAGDNLKDTLYWNSSYLCENNNSSGFSALPGGYCTVNGVFGGMGLEGSWWSSSLYSTYSAWTLELSYYSEVASRNMEATPNGFSVRCIKDTITKINENEKSIDKNYISNPVNGYISVEFDFVYNAIIEIISMNSQIVKSIKTNDKETVIDIRNLSSGVYIMRIINNNELRIVKFIKQ